ncbi:MAG: hydantoinase/oxoprolinase family protein [Paracoccaceae bacterium]
MAHNGQKVRMGVDIGGTFTDVALEIGQDLFSVKVLTTYDAPEQAILDAVARVVADAKIELEQIDLIIHGTTLATNALIERHGAKTAFLTTKGFRDVIEMRTENRFEQYDLNIVLPAALIARDSRYVAAGRMGPTGRELEPLDETAVVQFARSLESGGYTSVAIGFIHSYVNKSHEIRAREIISEHAPAVDISISAEVSPQMREFERFNTVCANAFVKPLMASYLNRLVEKLTALGTVCPVYMIHSGGGLISMETAAEFPVRLLESGPAGGAIFAADIAARHGLQKILSFDMGGTTAKICLVEDFTPKTARTFEVARTYRFKKGSGMPISIPVIEMVEIGAGGGSIAHVDGMHQIRVGPKSAGSEPGPACYQRGGTDATVTDADLMLGRLDPDNFAGGDFQLSRAESKKALHNFAAQKLGISEETAAIGISEVVDENMANAARVHAVESGKELQDFTMVAYGGGAPLHANRLCEKLGIDTLLVPPGAGVGSAIGFLRAPFGYEAVQGAYMRLSQFDAAKVSQTLGDLKTEAVAVARQGSPDGSLEIEFKAYMRYRGQGWEIPILIPNDSIENIDETLIRNLFETEYLRIFGAVLQGLDIEVMNWSVRANSPIAPVKILPQPTDLTDEKSTEARKIYNPATAEFLEAAIVQRSDLTSGTRIDGPAVIVEDETTTIVLAQFEAVVQTDNCLRLQRKAAL